jgi:hypothetical protein
MSLDILCAMKPLILIVGLVLIVGSAQAEKVYKVIQPDGTVEYTDAPPADEPAKEIRVEPINTIEAPAPSAGSSGQPTDSAQAGYSEVRITSPANDVSIRDNAGNVNVDVSLEPALRSGDKIDLLLDGQSVGGGKKTAITLTDMERGTHSLQALVKDASGKVVARSNTVTFTLQRRSVILQPPPAKPSGGSPAS